MDRRLHSACIQLSLRDAIQRRCFSSCPRPSVVCSLLLSRVGFSLALVLLLACEVLGFAHAPCPPLLSFVRCSGWLHDRCLLACLLCFASHTLSLLHLSDLVGAGLDSRSASGFKVVPCSSPLALLALPWPWQPFRGTKERRRVHEPERFHSCF